MEQSNVRAQYILASELRYQPPIIADSTSLSRALISTGSTRLRVPSQHPSLGILTGPDDIVQPFGGVRLAVASQLRV